MRRQGAVFEGVRDGLQSSFAWLKHAKSTLSLTLAAVRASGTDQYLQDPVAGQLVDVSNVYDVVLDEGMLAGTPLDTLAFRDETFADPGRTTVRKATDLEVIGRPSDLYLGGLEKCTDVDHAQATISSRQISAIFVVTRQSYDASGNGVFVRAGAHAGVGLTITGNGFVLSIMNPAGGLNWSTTLWPAAFPAGIPHHILLSYDSETGVLFGGVYQAGVQDHQVSVGAHAVRVQDIREPHYIGRYKAAGGGLTNMTINSMMVIDGAAIGRVALEAIMTHMLGGGSPADLGYPHWIGLSGGAHQTLQPGRLVYAGGAGAAVEVQAV